MMIPLHGYNAYSREKEKERWKRNNAALEKWNKFVKGCSDNELYEKIPQFFCEHIDSILGPKVVNELNMLEQQSENEKYMLLLREHIDQLDWFARNYLYFNWIKMSIFGMLNEKDKKTVESVPIFPIPNTTDSFAVTVKNSNGPIILISFVFSMLAMDVFKVIAREIERPDKIMQKEYFDLAAKKILAYIKSMQESLDSSYKFEWEEFKDIHILIADLLNNQLHSFVLLHEYSHIILGHLDKLDIDLTKPLEKSELRTVFQHMSIGEPAFTSQGIEIPLEKSKIMKDLEADNNAVSVIVKPSTCDENIRSNVYLANSIFVFHHLQMIARSLLGFSPSSFSSNMERLSITLSNINEAGMEIPIIQECSILELALNAVQKDN